MMRHRQACGFTLIEVLVALAIFSVLGVGAYTLLDSTATFMSGGEARFAALGSTQVALRLLEEDFTELSPRTVTLKGGGLAPALDGAPAEGIVEFTRSGWRNPLGARRSRLQRVIWEVDDGRLLRRYRTGIDQAEKADTVVRNVADDIEVLEIRYLDQQGNWLSRWPPAPRSSRAEDDTGAWLPLAVQIHLTHTQLGEVTRLVSLR
jgi:general secretion pathway protein J